MISSVSTLAMRQAELVSIAQVQSRLAQAAAEVSTGRHYDVGLALGSAIGRSLNLHQVAGQISTVTSTNALARARLETTQAALSEVADISGGLIDQVVAFRNSGTDRSQLLTNVRVQIDRLTSLMATTFNGQNVFSGENTDQAALKPYLTDPPSASQVAVQDSFAAFFGFPASDPQVASISSAQMSAFLDGDFSQNFADPSWGLNFSAATDAPLLDRIGLSEAVETPVSANDAGIRKLASALIAILDAGTKNLNAGAFETLMDRVASLAGEARGEITKSRAIIGLNLDRITQANDRLSIQASLVTKQIASLEEVDSSEASVRLNLLRTKLEVSYAATARLQGLSLLNYL